MGWLSGWVILHSEELKEDTMRVEDITAISEHTGVARHHVPEGKRESVFVGPACLGRVCLG